MASEGQAFILFLRGAVARHRGIVVKRRIRRAYADGVIGIVDFFLPADLTLVIHDAIVRTTRNRTPPTEFIGIARIEIGAIRGIPVRRITVVIVSCHLIHFARGWRLTQQAAFFLHIITREMEHHTTRKRLRSLLCRQLRMQITTRIRQRRRIQGQEHHRFLIRFPAHLRLQWQIL